MGQIKFITSLVLVALFTVAITTYAINFAIDNNANVSLADDSDFLEIRGDIKENLTVFYSDVNTSSDAMYKSTISSQTEATEGGTSFKVAPGTALQMAFSSITLGFRKIFGSDSGFGIFLTALISILGFISIMYLYKAWAGRNPD